MKDVKGNRRELVLDAVKFKVLLRERYPGAATSIEAIAEILDLSRSVCGQLLAGSLYLNNHVLLGCMDVLPGVDIREYMIEVRYATVEARRTSGFRHTIIRRQQAPEL